MKIKEIRNIISSIKDSQYYEQALTHVSFCFEQNIPSSKSYEILEFLGDSILNFHVSHYIFKTFPEFNEGKMSKLKQLMIQDKTLASIAREIELSQDIRLGVGEKKNNGLQKDNILADIMESFIAALFLEKGHLKVRRFLELTLFTWSKGKENLVWDYKSQLQEHCQANKNSVSYRLLESRWEKNEFVFEVCAEDKFQIFREKGKGRTRKAAEQEAAAKVLKKLGLL